jgi:hypothetical protein
MSLLNVVPPPPALRLSSLTRQLDCMTLLTSVPRRPQCFANHGASPATCCASHATTLATLPCCPHCHAFRAAMLSVLLRCPLCYVHHCASPAACRASRVATPAQLPRRPRCHTVHAAMLSTLPRQSLCLAGRVSLQPCCYAGLAATLSSLQLHLHCHIDQAASRRRCCLSRHPLCHADRAAIGAAPPRQLCHQVTIWDCRGFWDLWSCVFFGVVVDCPFVLCWIYRVFCNL